MGVAPVSTPTTMQFSSRNIFVMIVIAAAIVEAMPADDMIVPEPSQLGNTDILHKVLAQLSELRSNYDQLRSDHDQQKQQVAQLLAVGDKRYRGGNSCKFGSHESDGSPYTFTDLDGCKHQVYPQRICPQNKIPVCEDPVSGE